MDIKTILIALLSEPLLNHCHCKFTFHLGLTVDLWTFGVSFAMIIIAQGTTVYTHIRNTSISNSTSTHYDLDTL